MYTNVLLIYCYPTSPLKAIQSVQFAFPRRRGVHKSRKTERQEVKQNSAAAASATVTPTCARKKIRNYTRRQGRHEVLHLYTILDF